MANVEELVEQIGNLTLVQASELKKALEDKFGVTAAAPMMMKSLDIPFLAGAPSSISASAAMPTCQFLGVPDDSGLSSS